MSKMQRLPKRDQVPAEDTWDLASLFDDDAAWEAAFERYERRIKGYEKYRGKLGDSADDARQVPGIRQSTRSVGRAAGSVCLSPDRRRSNEQRLSAHAGTLSKRGDAHGRGGQLHSAGTPGAAVRPAAQAHGPRGHEVLSPADGAVGAFQAPHARQEGRRTAGHARRDGPGRQPSVPPAARRRSEVRLRHERARGEDRAEQCDLLAAAALTQTRSASRGVSPVLCAVFRP